MSLAEAENHMVVGNDLQDAPELSKQEIRELFQEWYEGKETDTHYFELFLEAWEPIELLTFSEAGTTQGEFKMWQADYLQKEFKDEQGEHISTLEVMQEI